MILEVIIKGFIVGLLSSLPFGPVGAFCIKKSLVNKNIGGYFAGFGAATADAFFALIASFGMITVYKFLINNEVSIGWVGGIFLIVLGVKEFVTKIPLNGKVSNGKKTLLKEFASGFSLAIANPFVIFSFLALYALLGIGRLMGNFTLSMLLVVSTFFGAFIGLTLLNWIVMNNKEKIKGKVLDYINKVIGTILFGTGVYLIIKSAFI